MNKRQLAVAALLAACAPVVACVASSSEDAATGASALSTPASAGSVTSPGGNQTTSSPCGTLDQDAAPSGASSGSGSHGSSGSSSGGGAKGTLLFCPSPVTSLDIAPGQTTQVVLIEIDIMAQITPTISGLPAGVTATWVQTSPYVPPVQGVMGAFEFAASLTAPPGSSEVTISAQSGNATGSFSFRMVVGGTCVPETCGSQCGAPADGCSGKMTCGGCPSGDFCNANFKCQVSNPGPACPKGTHSCGDGTCAKVCQ